MNNILFIAPHPDDETLGCGGTIFKHKAMNDKISWLIMTNISPGRGYKAGDVEKRQKEIEATAGKYGFDNVIKLGFPTAGLDTVPHSEVVEAVRSSMDRLRPDTVYVPNRNDVHSDHRVTFDAVISSAKSFRCPFLRKILMYEVISDTEFSPPLRDHAFCPNAFSDISEYLDKKLSVMRVYASELGEHPFPRNPENIKALATFRGATAGTRYAEAFMTVKEVW